MAAYVLSGIHLGGDHCISAGLAANPLSSPGAPATPFGRRAAPTGAEALYRARALLATLGRPPSGAGSPRDKHATISGRSVFCVWLGRTRIPSGPNPIGEAGVSRRLICGGPQASACEAGE